MSRHSIALIHSCIPNIPPIYLSINCHTMTAHDLVAYIQFKAEALYGIDTALRNSTIAQFLTLVCAEVLEPDIDESLHELDAYCAREGRCGDWYIENYKSLDNVYGELSEAHLHAMKEKRKVRRPLKMTLEI